MLFISIIVPVFNRKGFIRRCVDSILRQTFADYEIIIVDDGSNDGTEKICDRYGQAYDKVKVIHQKNSGVSKARNEGLKVVEGEYVTFLDSDDSIPSDYLQKIKDAYEKYGPEVMYCTSFRVDTDNGSDYYRYGKNSEYSFIKDDICPLFKNTLFNSAANKIYNTLLVEKYVIKFPESLELGEDLIFNLRYMDKLQEINFLLLNNNFYHQCQKGRKHSLETDWRENYFGIQRLLLRQKIKYINRWIGEGKLQPNSRKIFTQWYDDCIRGSIYYYIANIRHTRIITTIRYLVKIKYSAEYETCVRLNNAKKGFFIGMLYHAWEGRRK